MHFVSIGTLIYMLLFWVGTYLVTIWLMSLLFPAVSKGKRDNPSELRVENVSAIDRQVLATPQEPFCIIEGANSDFDISKNIRQDAVRPLIEHKRHIGG